MLALHSVVECGAQIPKKNLDAAREYVRRCAVSPDLGGGFAYQPGFAANQTRTGIGMLMLEIYGPDEPLLPGAHLKETVAGGDFLIANPPSNPEMEFYYCGVFFCSQALNKLGGKYWETVYPKLRKTLLAQQNIDGSFGGIGGGQEGNAGPAYRSAMACLALCVPSRRNTQVPTPPLDLGAPKP